MRVKERMTPDPITIAPQASVDEALKLMREHGVRHLPVVEGEAVVGMVNDIELRTAWFPSLLDELTVKDVMVNDPMTIQAGDTVYQAARLLYQHKLTGLLVVEDDHLVGIITLADILGIFVELLGLLGDSCRIDVAIRPGEQNLEQIYSHLTAQGADIISVALVSNQPGRRVYSLRLDCADAGQVCAQLGAAGFEILE